MKLQLIGEKSVIYLMFFFFFIMALATGFRPDEVGADTLVYKGVYDDLLKGQASFGGFEALYGVFQSLFVFLNMPADVFFSFLSALSFLFIFLSFHNLNYYFNRSSSDSRVFVVGAISLLISVFFYAAQLNIIRQGLSCFALIYAFSSILNARYGLFFFISLIVAVGVHFTGLLFISALFFLLFRYCTVVFIIFILSVFYALGWSEKIVLFFSGISGFDLHGALVSYGEESGYAAGVRIDFLFFSLFLGGGLDFLIRFFPGIQRDLLLNFLKLYWVWLAPFLALGFGAYSDRFLINAWIFSSFAAAAIIAFSIPRKLYSNFIGFFLYALMIAVLLYCLRAQGITDWSFS